MRRLLALWLSLACAAPAPAAPTLPRAESSPALELAGRPVDRLADMWRWRCCNGRYAGGLALTRSGDQLRGIFLTDEGMATYVDGAVEGARVGFTRRWLNAGRSFSQIYTARLSEDGQRLEGSFTETHAPGPPIDFSAERRFQPQLQDFNPTPTASAAATEELGTSGDQGQLLPRGCDCSRPCGCSGIPQIMECHNACGCPACPPGIP